MLASLVFDRNLHIELSLLNIDDLYCNIYDSGFHELQGFAKLHLHMIGAGNAT